MAKNDKQVQELQDELKLLKNEIKETLVDIREHLLTYAENPFAVSAPPPAAPAPAPPQQPVPEPRAAKPAPSAQPPPAPAAAAPTPPQATPTPPQATPTPPPPAWSPPPAVTPAYGGGAAPPIIIGGPGPVGGGSSGGSSGGGGSAMADIVAAKMLADMAKGKPEAEGGKAQQSRERPRVSGTSEAGPALDKTRDRASESEDGDDSMDLGELFASEDATLVPLEAKPAPKKTNGASRPVQPKESQSQPGPETSHGSPGPPPPWANSPAIEQESDLITLAMLSDWIEENLDTLGQNRVKAVIDIYASMGGLSDQLKAVLTQLVDLDEHPGDSVNHSTSEYLGVLAELENRIQHSQSDRAGAALISMLLEKRKGGAEANAEPKKKSPSQRRASAAKKTKSRTTNKSPKAE